MDKFDEIGATVKQFNSPTVAEAPEGHMAGQGVTPQEQVAETEQSVREVAEKQAQLYKRDQAAGGATHNKLDSVAEKSPFMTLSTDWEELKGFSKEYHPGLKSMRCVADRAMLFSYMVRTERTYNITLSFPAYGVDPIVFDEEAQAAAADIAALRQAHLGEDAGEGNTSAQSEADIMREQISALGGVEVILPSAEPGDNEELTRLYYEKIEVDGVLYFSCLMECLNPEYLHSIIREATEEIYTHGQYMYTLVGPRPLVKSGDTPDGGSPLIETLKLNTYEMNVLTSYVSGIEGVEVTHGIFDGRQAILFKRAV